MKYTAKMASGAKIYIPSFIKIGSDIQTLIWGGGEFTDTQTYRQHCDLINLLLLFFRMRKLG
jgi:hypothetical protein